MTDGRQLLDENGNLFGVVNIVDVLVVLMVLAVAAAGGALVLAAGDEPTEEPEPDTATKYATIDLGNQPDHVVEQIEEGDSVDLGGQSSLTITDMHATPVANPDDDTDIHLAIRAEVEGVMEDDSFRIGDEGLQLGQEFELDTEEYTANGEVTAVDDESDALARTTKPVLIETSMGATTAEEIQPGDEHELAGSTVATVAEVYSYPTASDERLVLLGVELTALEGVDQPTYGGDEVTTDTQIAFSTAAYDVTGPVIRSDSTTEFGEPTTTTAEVELTGVDEVLIQSASTQAEWESIVEPPIDEPVVVDGGELRTTEINKIVTDRTMRLNTTDNLPVNNDEFEGGTASSIRDVTDSDGNIITDQSEVSNGTPDRLQTTVSFEYDVSNPVFGYRISDSSANAIDNGPPLDIFVNGERIEGFVSGFGSFAGWRFALFEFGVEAGESIEILVEINTDEWEVDEDYDRVAFDLWAIHDGDFTFDFQETLDGPEGRLERPSTHPELVEIGLNTANTRRDVTQANFESIWNNTENEQYVELANDGATFTRFNNAESGSVTFADAESSVDTNIGLSRFSDGEERTPTALQPAPTGTRRESRSRASSNGGRACSTPPAASTSDRVPQDSGHQVPPGLEAAGVPSTTRGTAFSAPSERSQSPTVLSASRSGSRTGPISISK